MEIKSIRYLCKVPTIDKDGFKSKATAFGIQFSELDSDSLSTCYELSNEPTIDSLRGICEYKPIRISEITFSEEDNMTPQLLSRRANNAGLMQIGWNPNKDFSEFRSASIAGLNMKVASDGSSVTFSEPLTELMLEDGRYNDKRIAGINRVLPELGRVPPATLRATELA